MNAATPLDETAKAAARYQVELAAKKEAAEHSSQVRALWEQELDRLTSRRTTCTILGIFIALALAYFLVSSVLFSPYSTIESWTIPFFLGVCLIVGLWAFTIPFGFCPLIDFMKRSGFWIFGGWVLMLILFAFVVIFAYIAGPFYFFYLKSKIKEAKVNIEQAKQYEQTAYADYQAY